MAKGGTGGGAIKITAGGTLSIGADIFADGGQGVVIPIVLPMAWVEVSNSGTMHPTHKL